MTQMKWIVRERLSNILEKGEDGGGGTSLTDSGRKLIVWRGAFSTAISNDSRCN